MNELLAAAAYDNAAALCRSGKLPVALLPRLFPLPRPSPPFILFKCARFLFAFLLASMFDSTFKFFLSSHCCWMLRSLLSNHSNASKRSIEYTEEVRRRREYTCRMSGASSCAAAFL